MRWKRATKVAAIGVTAAALASVARPACGESDESPKELAAELKELTAPSNRLDIRVDAGVVTSLPRRGGRAALSLEIATHFDYWYGVAVSTAPPTVTTTTTSGPTGMSTQQVTRDGLAFSARIFKRIGAAVVSGGLIDGGAGLGFELRGWADRMRLEMIVADAQPWTLHTTLSLRAGASAQWRWLYVQAGAQDLLDPELRAAYGGIGLRWHDPFLGQLVSWVSPR